LAQPSFADDEVRSSGKTLALGNVWGQNLSSAAIWENPASLQASPGGEVGMLSTSYLAGENKVQIYHGAYPLFDQFVLGAGYATSGIDGFESTTVGDNGRFESTGTFGVKESHVVGGMSYRLNGTIHLGASVDMMSRQVDTVKGKANSIDLGLMLDYGTQRYSAVAKNVAGTALSYSDGSKESRDRLFAFSAYFKPKEFPELAGYAGMDLVSQSSKWAVLPKIGGSWQVVPELLELRGGYRFLRQLNRTRSSLSLGVGINYRAQFGIDYSYQTVDYFSNQANHVISLVARF